MPDAPCFVLRHPDGTPADDADGNTPHFLTEADAIEGAKCHPLHDGESAPAPVRLAKPCAAALRCGSCQDVVEDDDVGGIVHYDSVAEAEEHAAAQGWLVTPHEVLCPACRPAVTPVQDLSRVPGAGQLALEAFTDAFTAVEERAS